MPAKLVGTTTWAGLVPRRLTPIFRDREELSASHDLGGNLTEALRDSAFLLVICSPASARSRWVAEEILSFKRIHGEDRVLALVVAGSPKASKRPGDEDQECFPLPLRYVVGADGELSDEEAHPIAADIREGKDGRPLARSKLIAGLTGLRLDDVVQREAQRRVRRLTTIATAASVGMALTGALALYANFQRIEAVHQRIEAVRQRQIADRESAAARASADFLIGTFRLTNPATENPRTVTALSILERGANRVLIELAAQPDTQSRMLATVSNAYNNLGLRDDAQALLEKSLPSIRRAGPQGARALEQLAVTYIAQGQLDIAMATVNQAEAQLGQDPKVQPEIRGNLERARAKILFAKGDPRGGLAAIDHALALFRTAPNVPPRSLAIALQTRGIALSDDGQFDAANTSLMRSLTLFRRALGETDFLTGKAYQSLAKNDVSAGRLADAEAHIGRALVIERKVLTPDNPLLADDIVIEGQIYLEQRKFNDSAAALSQAVAIYKRAYGKPYYQTGIALVYLALAESGRGRTAAALADLDEAKHNYDVSYGKLHPNHGDLLVNRATVLAKAGRRSEGVKDCAAGVAILDQTLGADAAFTKANVAICAKL